MIHAARSGWGRAWLRAVHGWQAVGRAWRRSLRLRVVTTVIGVGLAGLVALGFFVTDWVRDSLYEQRVSAALLDSATQTIRAQEQFDASTATTPAQVQRLAQDLVMRIQSPGTGAWATLLLRSPSDEPLRIIDVVTGDRGIVSDELRGTIQVNRSQFWQPVSLTSSAGGIEPGIVIGAPVTLPQAGPYELYFVYSLQTEQTTLETVQNALVIGGVGLIALLAMLMWSVTRQVLAPVQAAATSAERLADGNLEERMPVRGEDELATLGRSFNDMAESLERQFEQLAELSRVQQRFVSDVSHELRTPLTTIRMAAEILHAVRADFDPATRRSAELLRDQVDRFEYMLADLLEISRFDAGAAVLDTEVVDVRGIVAHTVAGVAPLAESRGSRVLVDSPADPCTVQADARRIERVLRNLVVNAIEHGEGRDVEVRVGADEGAVAIVVRDHGIGMDAEQLGRAFDRFWRADPARARTSGGTGLGLSIAMEDTRLHAGRLDAWGLPGEGAAFRLTLPRTPGTALAGSPLPLEPSADREAAAPRPPC